MVQVDVFWSYGIGAGVAVANLRQVGLLPGSRTPPQEVRTPVADLALFLSCAFVPSGTWLLTAFPHWETMHVARGFGDLPAWLVTGFTLTNVTQGLLGYAVGTRLLRAGHTYAAYLQWLLAYFGMFFILVHGWDGTGYQRFFSSRPELLDGWTWADAGRWFGSDVAVTLYVMGLVVIPWLLGLMARPLVAGFRADPLVSRAVAARTVWGVALDILAMNTVGVVSIAIAASLCVRYGGWVLGSFAFVVLAWAVLVRPGQGLLHRHFRALVGTEAPAVVGVPVTT